MIEKEYKKILRDGQKFLNKEFSRLLAGHADALHPAISQKAKDAILIELARFRDYKQLEIKYIDDEGAGSLQRYKVIVQTETEMAEWEVSIVRGLKGVRWVFYIQRPVLKKSKKLKTKEKKESKEKVNDKQPKENRGGNTKGTGRSAKKSGKKA